MSGGPTLSGWLFYASNIGIIAADVVVIVVLLRGRALARRLRWRTRIPAAVFFAACAFAHGELARHAFFNIPLINPEGVVDIQMQVFFFIEGLAIWGVILTAASKASSRRSSSPLPLERSAVDPERDP